MESREQGNALLPWCSSLKIGRRITTTNTNCIIINSMSTINIHTLFLYPAPSSFNYMHNYNNTLLTIPLSLYSYQLMSISFGNKSLVEIKQLWAYICAVISLNNQHWLLQSTDVFDNGVNFYNIIDSPAAIWLWIYFSLQTTDDVKFTLSHVVEPKKCGFVKISATFLQIS